MAGADKLGMDLPRTIDAQILGVQGEDLLHQFLVAQRTGGRGVLLGCVVGAWSDLHASIAQDAADRLDSKCTALDDPITVGVDVVHDHRDRYLPRGYLILRSSSAAAKKAALVFKISFARRSSRTSRSSAVIRA